MQRVLLLVWLFSPVVAVTPAPAQEAAAGTTIRATAEEVLVDVIVREKGGTFLNDLKADEVRILEDGKEQQVTSFRLISGREAIAQAGEAPKLLDPLRQVRLVSLVFERLDNEARQLARQAALDLLKDKQEPNIYYSVMRIDNNLRILLPFTNDRKRIEKAVEAATGDAKALRADLNLELLAQQAAQAPQPGELTGPEAATLGAAIAEAEMARVIQAMVQFSDAAQAQQLGASSIFSLLALVKGQQSLPGRKTVLYFSEGLSLPNTVLPQFESLVGAANSANVAFYSIDARGLMSARMSAGNAAALMEAAQRTADSVRRLEGGASAEELRAADTAQNAIRSNTQANLEELAVKTGGFLTANTNDLRKPMRHVVEDIYSYYEISYRPSNRDYNGAFRRLEVRVDRPKAEIQSRSGYFAMPPELKEALFPYEVPLLKAIAMDRPPAGVEFRLKPYLFQPGAALGRCAFDIEVPFANMKLERDPATGIYKSGVSAVVLVKDAQGRIARKFTRIVPLQITEDKIEALKAGSFIYNDHLALPPGQYTLEAAVGDVDGAQVSVRRSPLTLPSHTGGVTVSDIVLVRRMDPLPKESAAADVYNPFLFGEGKVVPSLQPVDSKVEGAMVSLYFLIYPDPRLREEPKLSIEFYAGEQRIGILQPQLPKPDDKGRIPYVASVAAAQLPAGDYNARVIAEQAGARAESRTVFAVQ